MPKLWSEIRRARAMEIIADAAMLIWVGSWTTLSWRLYNFLAGFARAGRSIREGGASLNTAGDQIGEALGRSDHRPCSGRSEEHTSELQSHHDLVCRLLLEKKKKKT